MTASPTRQPAAKAAGAAARCRRRPHLDPPPAAGHAAGAIRRRRGRALPDGARLCAADRRHRLRPAAARLALSIADSLQLVDDEWRMDMPYAALALLEQAPRDRVFYQVRAGDGALVSGYPDLPAPPVDGARPTTRPHRGCSRRATRASRCASPGWSADRRSRRHAQRTRPGRPDERGARCAGRARVLWRGTLALLGFTAAALALAWWPAPFAGADPPHRARAGRTRRVRPATHQGAVPEELDTLVHTLDGFMARLAENLDTLRLFIAEAAHQLRTPLAAARADGSGAGRGRPRRTAPQPAGRAAQRRETVGWSTSCSATPA